MQQPSKAGRKRVWIVVAIVIAALALGLVVQRMILSPTQPKTTTSYQARLIEIENQGYSSQEAQQIASANISFVSYNSTYVDVSVLYPSGLRAEEIINVKENDSFTPTSGEIDNASLGNYDINFSAV